MIPVEFELVMSAAGAAREKPDVVEECLCSSIGICRQAKC